MSFDAFGSLKSVHTLCIDIYGSVSSRGLVTHLLSELPYSIAQLVSLHVTFLCIISQSCPYVTICLSVFPVLKLRIVHRHLFIVILLISVHTSDRVSMRN
jgi:hypothetical protein